VLARCLRALLRQESPKPFEIIVADSGADPAVDAVLRDFPDVIRASERARLFPGGARNLGARRARGSILAFIDADCVPEPGWIAALVEALSTAAVRVVGGPVLDARRGSVLAATDNLLQFVDFPAERPEGPISHLPSSNLAIRREPYWELGGMCADFPVCEDGLFSTAAGERWPDSLWFANRMRVRHDGRATLRAFLDHQRTFGFFRGRVGSRLRRADYQRWGRHAIFLAPIVGVRLLYIVKNLARWNPRALRRLPAAVPALILGLAVWALAFRRGCCAAGAVS